MINGSPISLHPQYSHEVAHVMSSEYSIHIDLVEGLRLSLWIIQNIEGVIIVTVMPQPLYRLYMKFHVHICTLVLLINEVIMYVLNNVYTKDIILIS